MTTVSVTPHLTAGTAVPTSVERLLLHLSARVIVAIDNRLRRRARAAFTAHARAHEEAVRVAAAVHTTGLLPR
jgi:hypothetical protein